MPLEHSMLNRLPIPHVQPPTISEVLPKAGLVVSEKGGLAEILCKPKILPLKSITLQKLEEMEVGASVAHDYSTTHLYWMKRLLVAKGRMVWGTHARTHDICTVLFQTMTGLSTPNQRSAAISHLHADQHLEPSLHSCCNAASNHTGESSPGSPPEPTPNRSLGWVPLNRDAHISNGSGRRAFSI